MSASRSTLASELYLVIRFMKEIKKHCWQLAVLPTTRPDLAIIRDLKERGGQKLESRMSATLGDNIQNIKTSPHFAKGSPASAHTRLEVIRQLNGTMRQDGVPPHLAALIYISTAASNQANTGARRRSPHTQPVGIRQRLDSACKRSKGSPARYIICHDPSRYHQRVAESAA